jgi:hypothetical protein
MTLFFVLCFTVFDKFNSYIVFYDQGIVGQRAESLSDTAPV